MKLAIMQPYFFPYLGYFQLIASVDRFVVLDDVHYINRGWINRNRIWNAGKPAWLTMPLCKASQNRLIREIDIQPHDSWRPKMLRTLEQAYSKAAHRDDMLALFSDATGGPDENLSSFLVTNLKRLCEALSIDTTIVPTSSVYPKGELHGQDRILDICVREGATTYVNPPGGKDLYTPGPFQEAGVSLRFQNPQLSPAGLQFSGDEGATLPILDLLSQNSTDLLAASLRGASGAQGSARE